METDRITIHISNQQVNRFFNLLEIGFWVPAMYGTTIAEVVVNGLDVDRHYLKNDIQTIFLNGRPVDDPDQASLTDGDRIAFSASMPGLLGATMRKGGFYRAMRQSISFNPDDRAATTNTEIWIMVKCFNLIARELAPHLLSRGIWLDMEIFKNYLSRRILPAAIDGTWQTPPGRSGSLSEFLSEEFPQATRQCICFPNAIDLKP